jgi:tetratricopeptide (TPR) repeat protein
VADSARALRTPEAPPSLPPREARREEAEALWRRADAMAKRGEHEAGLQTAREAMRLGHARPEHDALLGWLIFQHGGADPNVMPHVWKCLDRALKRESLCEQALYYKALILNLTGEPEQARAHLQRVLMLNPNHAEAAHELRIYELRRAHEQSQAGFLRRLLTGRKG